jgi:hypothetical protein
LEGRHELALLEGGVEVGVTGSRSILVIGNCQALPIGLILQEAYGDLITHQVLTVHLMRDSDRERALAAIESADVILAQRVDATYPVDFVRTEAIRDSLSPGQRMVVWPNLYFRGYNPELSYLRGSGSGLISGPWLEYHDSRILGAWRSGRSVDDTVRHILDDAVAVEKDIEQTFRELSLREADCDVTVSDYIAEHWADHRLLHTFNHPANRLLVHTAEALVMALGDGTLPTYATPDHEWLGVVHPPVNRSVSRILKPTFSDLPEVQGRECKEPGGGDWSVVRTYSWHELVESFFAHYDLVGVEEIGGGA